MDNQFIPAERLRVFISSAQSDEGLFAWSDVRQRVKKHLEECIYLNPFIIEDVASTIPSNQFYQQQLLKSDIVVLLVKGEVRKGTATEYALASRYKKPLLVYFLEDGCVPSLSVVELKSDIQSTDYCTYRQVKNFDDIEIQIRNDVIQDVIRYYQSYSFQYAELGEISETILPVQVDSVDTPSVPTKTALAQFSSSYKHLFELLSMNYAITQKDETLSPFHDFGVMLLDWLVSGDVPSCDTDILRLVEELTPVFSSIEWLKKRWDAIRCEWAGDLQGALAAEQQALSLAKAAQVPQWIISNILIDCRNMQNEVNQNDKQPFGENPAQKELDVTETIVYLPVLDRYLGNVYEAIHKEKQKIETAKPGTRFFGSNFESTMNSVENYFFSAVLYGSYSHMIIARDLLFNALWGYTEISEEEELLQNCINILALKGNATTFKLILDFKWDKVYTAVSADADKLWQLANKAPIINRDDILQAVFMKLGMYFSDDIFENAQKYIIKIADSIYWGNAENYFDCISSNMNRLNQSNVVTAICGILRNQRFHMGGKLSNILMQLHLETIDSTLQTELRDALVERIAFIVSNGGSPQFIAALASQNPKIFAALADVPDNGLNGIEKVLYEINMGHGDWGQVLKNEIQTARDQFEANKEPGKYIGFWERPYAMIKKVVREHYNSSMDQLLLKQFIPLCTEVLSSQIEAGTKNNCIDALCDVLICSKECKKAIPQELLNTISNVNWSECRSVWRDSNDGLSCRALMLKIITGIAGKEELMEWCFGYSKKGQEERVVLSKCIEQYLLNCAEVQNHADATILSIAIQCIEDEYWVVRKYACNSMAILVNSQYKPLVERKLYEAAIDPSHYVRNHVLRICKDGCINDAYISSKLIEILQNDANYAIRNFAKE